MALTKISRSLLDTGVSDSSDATAITIDSSENVLIGTSSSSKNLRLQESFGIASTGALGGMAISGYSGTTAANRPLIDIQRSRGTSDESMTVVASGDYLGSIVFRGADGTNFIDGAEIAARVDGTPSTSDMPTNLTFHTQADGAGGAAAERMRIDSSGAVLIGQTSSAQPVVADIAGIGFSASGLAEFQVDGGTVMRVGRLTNDGDLVEFRAQTQTEGKITVSGATVSYQGFSGSHESSGIATDTEIGTVCSTIDELDTYVSGNKSGQTRAEHAKIKVSDTVGDSRVYGVLNSYSETDNKPIVSSVGIGSVRVTGACNGGDLLESNGDGTAKVQDDDIIRSKTIGKVTIGNSNAGVKLVSCVLYCG
jgi:hypothetical protein